MDMNTAPKIASTFAAKADIAFGEHYMNSQPGEHGSNENGNTDYGFIKIGAINDIKEKDPAVNKAAEENEKRAEVKTILTPKANENALTALTKYYFKSNEGKHSNLPIDVELREATKRALRNAKSEHIRLEAIPMESKKCMLEVEFPSIRTIGRDKNSSHSTITDHGINYNDCVKTLSDSEIELLQNAVISHSNKNNILMMQQVWNQLGEFHQLLEENEASKMEIIGLRNHCTSLEKSQAEKDEKISSLERDFVEMKMELAQYKSMEDFHQMSMSKLETELTRSKELLNSSSRSGNNYDAEHDESPKMNRHNRRRSSMLTQSCSEKEIGCNVRDPTQPMRNSRNNLITRSCKWVSEITQNRNADDPTWHLDRQENNNNQEEDLQQQSLFNRTKRSSSSTIVNSSSSRELWRWRVGPAAQDTSKLNRANIKGHRHSWSVNGPALGRKAHLANKSFIDPFETRENNYSIKDSGHHIICEHIIWGDHSRSGESDLKSGLHMPGSNNTKTGCTTKAKRGIFTGNAYPTSVEVDKSIASDNEQLDLDWTRISSLTFDTALDPSSVSRNMFQPASPQIKKSMSLRHASVEADLLQKKLSLLQRAKSEVVMNTNSRSDDKVYDSVEPLGYSLPKVQRAKSDGDVEGNIAPLGRKDSYESGISLAFC